MKTLTDQQTKDLAGLTINYQLEEENQKVIISRQIREKLNKDFSKELQNIASIYIWATMTNEKSDRIDVCGEVLVCIYGSRLQFADEVGKALIK